MAYRRALGGLGIAAAVSLLAAACTETPAPAKPEAVTPAAYQAAAQSVLGDDADVVLYGDLARDGHIQLLIVNRLPKTPKGVVPGLLVSRAAILQQEGSGDWREVLLADEHLKNPKGFLGGTPLASVGAWRLQDERGEKGLEMYFTPLGQSPEDRPPTIEVRWNPAARRYQSLDRDFQHFLGEVPSLTPPPEFLFKR